MSKVRIKSHYLQAMLLPEAITSESSLQELSTIQIEGFPLSFCSEEKIKDILKVICVDIAQSVKFIRVSVTRFLWLLLSTKNLRISNLFIVADQNTY